MAQWFILGPVGPRRMFSLYELNQPVAVGPVGQPFTTGPVGTHERVSDCKQMDRIADSPVGSTEILDPVKQTESPIQTDFMKIGTINEPASLGDTPPPMVVQLDGVLVITVCLQILRKMKISIIPGRTVC